MARYFDELRAKLYDRRLGTCEKPDHDCDRLAATAIILVSRFSQFWVFLNLGKITSYNSLFSLADSFS